MDRWAYESHVELDFSRPGKPTDNAQDRGFRTIRMRCARRKPSMLTDCWCHLPATMKRVLKNGVLSIWDDLS